MMGALTRQAAEDIVDAAIADYIAGCHARVAPFVDRHFTLKGSAALHRRALGWDLARAPANLLLAVPQLGARTLGFGLQRLGLFAAGKSLSEVEWLRRTQVAEAIGRLIEDELLQLAPRPGEADGLATALAADPTVAATLEAMARHVGDPVFRQRLEAALNRYVETRAAAAEIATALTSLGVGALAFKQLTPSLLSLGPVLAGALAQSAAVTSFPLGAGLGGLWHSWFPASAGTALVAGVTGSLFLGVAVLSAFSGVITDPAQRALGLHQRRLHRLIDGMEGALRHGRGLDFNPRDHYVARLIDLIDIARLAHP